MHLETEGDGDHDARLCRHFQVGTHYFGQTEVTIGVPFDFTILDHETSKCFYSEGNLKLHIFVQSMAARDQDVAHSPTYMMFMQHTKNVY